jgi:nitrate reductase delta subunit
VSATATTVDRALALAFADLLSYPSGPLGEAVSVCEARAGERSPKAGAMLTGFRVFAESSTLGELQEAYTAAFDLDSLSDLEPTCYPYVGHHLFDENHKRSAFLVGLNSRYREHDFTVEGELPDHLAVMLRFVAGCDDELAAELVGDAIVPALQRMARGVHPAPQTGREHYQNLLPALRLVLGVGASESEEGSSG